MAGNSTGLPPGSSRFPPTGHPPARGRGDTGDVANAGLDMVIDALPAGAAAPAVNMAESAPRPETEGSSEPERGWRSLRRAPRSPSTYRPRASGKADIFRSSVSAASPERA